MSTPSTAQGTDLSGGGYPDFSPPYLPPSILFLHPSLSLFLRGREATRGARASPWKLTRETPFSSWAQRSSSVTRHLSHLPFRELLELLPGTAQASPTGVGRASVLSESRHPFTAMPMAFWAEEEWRLVLNGHLLPGGWSLFGALTPRPCPARTYQASRDKGGASGAGSDIIRGDGGIAESIRAHVVAMGSSVIKILARLQGPAIELCL